uniref:Putative secreted protein n=1 Tax=Ixodes ricinus TaxID=34613 RepID=A0A6B0U4E1_IXORI
MSKFIIYVVSIWKSKFITYACVSDGLHAFSTMFLHRGTQPRNNLASARSVQVCNGLTGMRCNNYLGRTVILYSILKESMAPLFTT